MRIAYLVNRYPFPSHAFIRREILALEELGVDVLRVSIRPGAGDLADPADAAESGKTFTLLRAGMQWILFSCVAVLLLTPLRFGRALAMALRTSRRSDRGLLRHLAYLAEACLLKRWCRSQRVEHIHAHFGTNPAMVAMLCRLLGGPGYSFTVHGPQEFDRPESLALAEKVQHAAFVAAISQFTRSQLYRWSRLSDWSRIAIVRCGVDDGFLDAAAAQVDEPNFVCVGRLGDQKGQPILLDAVRQLAPAMPALRVTLIGDGERRADLERLIRQWDLTRNVAIVGWASGAAIRACLQQARALVLPSFAEGLPVVIMEAFALGLPVIATSVGAISELVRPGENGWLVPPGDPGALAEALRQVMAASSQMRAAFGRHGRELVCRNHSARAEARRLKALFEACVPQDTRLAAAPDKASNPAPLNGDLSQAK